MILVALSCLAAAVENNIVSLTDKSFDRLVKRRPRNEVWLVMFTNEEPKCKKVKPKFRNASDISYGMIKFGSLDIDRFPALKEEFAITSLPTFRIFHSEGELLYNGALKVSDFLKKPMAFLKDASEEVKSEWKDEMLAKPSAILFSDKKVSAVWAGVSSFYQRKSVRIGFCNDSALAKEFGVETVPAIVLMNGTDTLVYNGTHKFRDVRTAIDKFFAKRLSQQIEDDQKTDTMMMPDEFADKCYGGKNLCVLAVSSKATDSMMKLQKELARHKVRWFVGKLGLPEKFMEEKGGVWIYNPRRDGFIHVEDPEALGNAMERVLDGTAKWAKKATFTSENKDL